MSELNSQLSKAKEDNEILIKRIEALERRNADLALAEDQKHVAIQDISRLTYGTETLPNFLQNKRVILVGVGTVGTLVAELLIRSKTKKLVIVDDGNIESGADLNAVLLSQQDVGRPK